MKKNFLLSKIGVYLLLLIVSYLVLSPFGLIPQGAKDTASFIDNHFDSIVALIIAVLVVYIFIKVVNRKQKPGT